MDNRTITVGREVHGADQFVSKQAQSHLQTKKEMLHIWLALCLIQSTGWLLFSIQYFSHFKHKDKKEKIGYKKATTTTSNKWTAGKADKRNWFDHSLLQFSKKD